MTKAKELAAEYSQQGIQMSARYGNGSKWHAFYSILAARHCTAWHQRPNTGSHDIGRGHLTDSLVGGEVNVKKARKTLYRIRVQ